MHFPAFWHERLQTIACESFLHKEEVKHLSAFFECETVWFWSFSKTFSDGRNKKKWYFRNWLPLLSNAILN